MLTPVELEALLRAYYLGDYPSSDNSDHSHAARAARKKFHGLAVMESCGGKHRLTDRGEVWVKEILATPVPEWDTRSNTVSL